MALLSELDSVVSTYRSEISLIGDFARYVDQSLTRKLKRKPSKPFNEDHVKELEKVAELISKTSDDKGAKTSQLRISKEVADFVMKKAVPIKHQTFLSEMTLSYLISHREAFIKDYLFQLFIHKKQLINSNATLTFKEINTHKSMKSLLSSMAQNEIDATGYGSIDDLAIYIEKR